LPICREINEHYYKMAGNSNSGRKRGDHYKRRTTTAEIERDARKRRRKEDKEMQQISQRRWQDFFAPQLPVPQQPQAPPNPPPCLPPSAQNRIDRDHPDPMAENPLPGIDMSRIPEMFQLPIGKVLHKLHAVLKKGQRKGNQHGQGASQSKLFPWNSIDYQWPDPRLIISRPATFVDYLLPVFGRVRVFLPDRTTSHHLPNGKLPCKFHGFQNDCVVKDHVCLYSEK
jgi:hypothetical protein